MENSDRVHWLANSEENIPYKSTTWYRCVGIEKFVNLVEEQGDKIVGIIFSENNLGFVLDNKGKKK